LATDSKVLALLKSINIFHRFYCTSAIARISGNWSFT